MCAGPCIEPEESGFRHHRQHAPVGPGLGQAKAEEVCHPSTSPMRESPAVRHRPEGRWPKDPGGLRLPSNCVCVKHGQVCRNETAPQRCSGGCGVCCPEKITWIRAIGGHWQVGHTCQQIARRHGFSAPYRFECARSSGKKAVVFDQSGWKGWARMLHKREWISSPDPVAGRKHDAAHSPPLALCQYLCAYPERKWRHMIEKIGKGVTPLSGDLCERRAKPSLKCRLQGRGHPTPNEVAKGRMFAKKAQPYGQSRLVGHSNSVNSGMVKGFTSALIVKSYVMFRPPMMNVARVVSPWVLRDEARVQERNERPGRASEAKVVALALRGAQLQDRGTTCAWPDHRFWASRATVSMRVSLTSRVALRTDGWLSTCLTVISTCGCGDPPAKKACRIFSARSN